MWKMPTSIKVYEALGAVADGRLEISGNSGKCFSSSGNKYYEVTYEPESNAIMANDNASYWNGSLGYPAVAFLLQTEVLPYKSELGELLKNIKWKDINQKFKNDFDKTVEYILSGFDEGTRWELEAYAEELLSEIEKMKLVPLGKKKFPPKGY